MIRFLQRFVTSYTFVLFVAIVIGLFVPFAKALVPYNMLALQGIFFLSSLKLAADHVFSQMKDWKVLLVFTMLMLVGLPVFVWLVVPVFVPDLAFALFLLAAMPVGMTTPLLVDVVGGDRGLALVVTIITSLIAPFSIPLLIRFFYGTTIAVDVWSMCRNLLLIIALPFALAMIARRIAPARVEAFNLRSRQLSLILLGFVIATAIAARAPDMLHALSSGLSVIWTMFALFVFFAVLHLVGLYAVWWKSREDRQTLSVCLTYMNFTLAIYLASTYFSDSGVVFPLVLSILPWALFLPIWKRITQMRILP